MKINLNDQYGGEYEVDLDRAIEWTNQRITTSCPICDQRAKVINCNGEGVLIVDHAIWCQHAYLNRKECRK